MHKCMSVENPITSRTREMCNNTTYCVRHDTRQYVRSNVLRPQLSTDHLEMGELLRQQDGRSHLVHRRGQDQSLPRNHAPGLFDQRLRWQGRDVVIDDYDIWVCRLKNNGHKNYEV